MPVDFSRSVVMKNTEMEDMKYIRLKKIPRLAENLRKVSRDFFAKKTNEN